MALDIMSEWKELLPDKIIDARPMVPRHPTMVWKKRSLSTIIGVCNHQTAGGENPVETAKYHIKSFNQGNGQYGAPSLCYTFYIRKSGEIWWCNDIEAITWSQGDARRAGSENEEFVSIVVGGNFSGPGYKGKTEPTSEQLVSLKQMWDWLLFHLHLLHSDVMGHFNFGKPACPGYSITAEMEKFKEGYKTSFTDIEWQRHLNLFGYDTGGIDGIWGSKSKSAIAKFQKDNKILVTGYKDDRTFHKMMSILIANMQSGHVE